MIGGVGSATQSRSNNQSSKLYYKESFFYKEICKKKNILTLPTLQNWIWEIFGKFVFVKVELLYKNKNIRSKQQQK